MHSLLVEQEPGFYYKYLPFPSEKGAFFFFFQQETNNYKLILTFLLSYSCLSCKKTSLYQKVASMPNTKGPFSGFTSITLKRTLFKQMGTLCQDPWQDKLATLTALAKYTSKALAEHLHLAAKNCSQLHSSDPFLTMASSGSPTGLLHSCSQANVPDKFSLMQL